MLGMASVPPMTLSVGVAQGVENRADRAAPEVDQRLRRGLRSVRLLEEVHQHRQGAVVARPPEELEDERFDVALGRGVQVLDERRDFFLRE